MSTTYQLFKETPEALILNLFTLLDNHIAHHADNGTNFKTIASIVIPVSSIQKRLIMVNWSQINCHTEHKQMQKQYSQTFQELVL
jgi:hypothetical protein